MPTRACGDVLVKVVYDRRSKIHPRVSGAYRARILVDKKVVDNLCIGVPRDHESRELFKEAIDEIAMTALEYSLGDHPELPIVRCEDGALELKSE